MPPPLNVPPRAAPEHRARAALDTAVEAGWVEWDLTQPLRDKITDPRIYRVRALTGAAPGSKAGPVFRLTDDEVPPWVAGVAATVGPAAVESVRYRDDLTE